MGQMGLVGHIRPNVPLYSAVNIHVTQTSSLWPRNFFENICNRISPRGTYSLNVRCSLKAGSRSRIIGLLLEWSPGRTTDPPWGDRPRNTGTLSYIQRSNSTNNQ